MVTLDFTYLVKKNIIISRNLKINSNKNFVQFEIKYSNYRNLKEKNNINFILSMILKSSSPN